MEISILRRQGLSLRQISRELGVSINTVRKKVEGGGGKPLYGPRPSRVRKVDAYVDYLKARIEGAKPYRIPATCLIREIRDRGYKGGLTQLKEFLRSEYPPKAAEPLVRFSTLPGAQLQVDWVEFKGEELYAFVATLGFSRLSFVTYRADMRLESFLSCHIEAFEFFGGVTREILYDNMKTVVLKREAYGPGRHQFHPLLWDLSRHYGFVPRLCRPYRAKTKGKVERFNGYLRHSFHNPLLTRLRMQAEGLSAQRASGEVLRWLREVANSRRHGETGEVPQEQYALEAPYLLPLAPRYLGKAVLMKEAQSTPRLYPIVPPQHGLFVYERCMEGV